jgi:hypothetical protein
VGKPEGKRPLQRPRCIWVENTIIFLGKIGWDVVDWLGLAQDRDRWSAFVYTVMSLQVP